MRRLVVAVGLLGCSVDPAEDPPVADGGSPQVEASLALQAYAALGSADRAARVELIAELDEAASGSDPAPRDVFYAGMMHLWRLAEGPADPEYDLATRAQDAGQAMELLDRAWLLEPGDARIPTFLGVAEFATGLYLNSDVLMETGRMHLGESVEVFPPYARFVRGLMLGELGRDDPAFASALDDLSATLEACAYQKDGNGDFVYPEGPLPGVRRVCNDEGIVPHVWEGVFLTYGDLLAKQGDASAAVHMYTQARSAPGYDRFSLADVLEARIADADRRVALYTDADPDNDPLPWSAEGRVCTGCHEDSP